MREMATSSEHETRALGEKIASLVRPGDVILLIGELGTGKTVLAKGIAQGLGIKEKVLSPTFTILKEYAGKIPLYHLDAYRLDGPRDLQDLGLEEYLEGGVLLVEWGDRVCRYFTADYLEIRIDWGGPESARRIALVSESETWRRRLDTLDLGGDLID